MLDTANPILTTTTTASRRGLGDISPRLAGAGAITFASIVTLQNVIRGGNAPVNGDSDESVLAHYADHRALTFVLIGTFVVSAIGLAVFVGGATRRLLDSDRRGWALAGVGAAVCGVATIITSSLVDTVYQEKYQSDLDGFSADLHDKTGVLFAFHSVTVLGAVLMLVFAAGLHRRLRTVMADSIVPTVAGAALAGTAVVSILGSGLDTEFMMALAGTSEIPDSSAAMYNNWIGTIPWLWTLAGLAGVGLYVASRRDVAPRWIGRVGLVLGGLTVLLGISPLEYMSGVTGVLWLLVTSLGLAFGDRRFRGATQA